MKNEKIILDLCGGTGAWSRPYMEAGYEVKLIDLPQDVRMLHYPGPAHGILAAPPCTYFCRMRMCRGRPTDEQFREGLSVVDACLRIIQMSNPQWWALENPQGYLHNWLGQPKLKFQPWEYGDPWTKRTWIWGNFMIPKKRPVLSAGPWLDSRTGHPLGRKGFARTASERSQTPGGFAQAFYEANP